MDLYIMLISMFMNRVCHPPCDESSKNYLTRASNESYTIAYLDHHKLVRRPIH
jgi:hypothetical protein